MTEHPTTNDLIDRATDRLIDIFERAGVPMVISQGFVAGNPNRIVFATDKMCEALTLARATLPDWIGDHIERAHNTFHELQPITMTNAMTAQDDPERVEIRLTIERLLAEFDQIDADLARAISEHN